MTELGAYRLWCYEDDCAWVRDGNNIRKLKAALAQHAREKHDTPSGSYNHVITPHVVLPFT